MSYVTTDLAWSCISWHRKQPDALPEPSDLSVLATLQTGYPLKRHPKRLLACRLLTHVVAPAFVCGVELALRFAEGWPDFTAVGDEATDCIHFLTVLLN